MTLKSAAKKLLPIVRPFASKLGARMLTASASRRLLNRSYENLGADFQDFFNYTLDGSQINKDFEWRTHLGAETIIVPVSPEFKRSWANARVWGWAGSRYIRRFYEFYLAAKPSGVMIDAGANDGMYTYPFAAHRYSCFAFEPQHSCVAYIERVRERNGYVNVQVEQKALFSEDARELDFYISESSWFSSLNRQHVEGHERAQAIKVRTTTLDAYCRLHDITPTFLKVDTEGAEHHVLKGAAKTLERCRPEISIEVDANPESSSAVWSLLSSFGYSCYAPDASRGKLFRRIQTKADMSKALAGRGNEDFFFMADTALIRHLESEFRIS